MTWREKLLGAARAYRERSEPDRLCIAIGKPTAAERRRLTMKQTQAQALAESAEKQRRAEYRQSVARIRTGG